MQKSSTILDMTLKYWDWAWDPIFFNVGSTIEDSKNLSEQSEASKKKSPTPWGYFREPTVLDEFWGYFWMLQFLGLLSAETQFFMMFRFSLVYVSVFGDCQILSLWITHKSLRTDN